MIFLFLQCVISCDYCVYHYKSIELVSLYTLDIGLLKNIIITLCRCGGYSDCDAYTVVCVACVYVKRV